MRNWRAKFEREPSQKAKTVSFRFAARVLDALLVGHSAALSKEAAESQTFVWLSVHLELMKYPGSKAQSGVPQCIIGQMPPHSVYAELFLGTGKIFEHKLPAAKSILVEKNPAVAARFGGAGVKVVCADALQALPVLALTLPADALVYCDPPYPLETRSGRKYYEHELTIDQHTSLLAALQALRCYVMISGRHCPLYDRTLKDWRLVTYKQRAHRRTITDCLWCNFPEPATLHDWRFAGRTHRQRVSLRRLKQRYLSRFERMEPRQRGYVLQAIAQRWIRREDPVTPLLTGGPGI